MSVRVYLPMTVAALADAVAVGLFTDVEPITANSDDEESEYDALMLAAEASQELLDGPGRRVVVVAEVPDLSSPIPMRMVVAAHVDTHARAPDADPDEDLAWFATQEIAALLAAL